MDLKDKLKIIRDCIISNSPIEGKKKEVFGEALLETILTLSAYEFASNERYKARQKAKVSRAVKVATNCVKKEVKYLQAFEKATGKNSKAEIKKLKETLEVLKDLENADQD